jgi:ABC-type multidrug transport system permease subunit
MLGGLFTTGMSMPTGFQRATLLVPQGWALRSWRLVLDGGDASAVLPAVLVELAIGAACFAVGAILFRRRFAHGGGS